MGLAEPQATTNSKGWLQKKRVPIIGGHLYLPESASEEPYLIGSTCHLCGYVSFPKRDVCPLCIQEDTMQRTPLSRRGKVFSFTTAWVAPPGFEIPYTQVWVDLPEGARVFATIAGRGTSAAEVQIGTEVELVTRKVGEDQEGNDIIGYEFRPVT